MGAGFLISYPTDGGLHGWENQCRKDFNQLGESAC